jgi:hypothetical protein
MMKIFRVSHSQCILQDIAKFLLLLVVAVVAANRQFCKVKTTCHLAGLDGGGMLRRMLRAHPRVVQQEKLLIAFADQRHDTAWRALIDAQYFC